MPAFLFVSSDYYYNEYESWECTHTLDAHLSNSEGTTITAIGITFAITFIAALSLGVGIGIALMCALRRISTVGKYSPKKEQEIADHDPSTYILSNSNTIQNVSYVPINVD